MGSRRLHFGRFQLAVATGELRREGTPVKLQGQPAKVLVALATRPGEVVSRDALKRDVWSEDTHVDFERGLNFCIAQIRSALGDSAASPRYIETVPKQGYRFIAPVRIEGPERTDHPDAPATDPVEPADLHTISRPVGAGLLAAAILVLAIVGWALTWTEPPTVVVVPFYNETGIAEHDTLARAIGDATVARLAAAERLPDLSVIGNASSLKNPFARQDVQQVARDLAAPWVLIGQLKSDGEGLRVIAHLRRASDMKHFWAEAFDDANFALDGQSRVAEAIAASVTASLTAGSN